ncbi:MAG: MATE family efflux transporter [Propionicimonas sp.]|uniref:MATE family efflux transporter n=1 Tax=Propionicimonas sp. TaxID=1955623 RepID=UPI002B1EB819|nr:MATE family efflux transporter [Propionicimonas sp.]MEA4943448.1 MATE family efflux transporter [Propionicimonas sp.]
MGSTPPSTHADQRRLDRELLALAVPAFATLLAEPLLVLADSAIIGHVSTDALAGLGIASSVVGVVVGLCVFLAYGTTASVARRLGAGDRAGALAGGLDGMTLGALIGVVLAIVLQVAATGVVGWYGVEPVVADQAASYLSVVSLGFPGALVILAATGVLRGLQDTRTPLLVVVVMNLANIGLNLLFVHGLGWGITGSGTGTALAQTGAAVWLALTVLRGARREQVRWRWHPSGILTAARSSGWLVLRTAGLQAALLLTTAVAARMGAVSMAAHQVLYSLWMLLTFAMDAVAIAAQALVGRYLGAGEASTVRSLLARMLGWGVLIGVTGGLLLWAGQGLYLWLFTPDAAVVGLVSSVLPLVAGLTVLGGVVFVLDGVLIGAGDTRYLAWASLVNLLVYLPLAIMVAVTGGGLVWLWLAYAGFTLSRFVTLGLRARGTGWMRLGV